MATILAWQDFGRMSSYRHVLIGFLPGFICWHIWKERYNRRFPDKYRRWRLVAMEIVVECNYLFGHKRFSFLEGHASSLRLAGFNVPTSLNVCCIPVSWSPPSIGLKANVDGSSSSASAGGGGLVRDVGGNVRIAFSYFYGKITNNEAEIRAIWNILVLCEAHGIDVVEV